MMMETQQVIDNPMDKINFLDSGLPDTLDKVFEKEFTRENPSIQEHIDRFRKQADISNIFSPPQTAIDFHPKIASKIIGSAWYEFSDTMPWVLCTLASKVDSNLIRHYIIQGAFEELGGRSYQAIHPDQFMISLEIAGVSKHDVDSYFKDYPDRESISFLKNYVNSISKTHEILGLGLGLELPAVENIETVFRALTSSSELEEKVAKTVFFKIHRVIEEEHIRLHVSNFLRFCKNDVQKSLFYDGFHNGMKFWQMFWSELTRFIKNGEPSR